ncbi:hypothetical protein DFA_04414 [Cavenderia fasciculata]|uniref:Uncharacterized protein n=1 Tax=Cavenderia fasciculata TaxID=261658 RepID=F4PPI3_CACFS|nr:uncharacterized protein DFA_04414 [Cavenderia fasciculata]EGG22296.1 hypothetical protein DFA_04414 [Cavenderia fasciculata]|eukprot:XP_004360147.1 hypothetical protein DFA_04414 [Cavenderia fasciculata]
MNIYLTISLFLSVKTITFSSLYTYSYLLMYPLTTTITQQQLVSWNKLVANPKRDFRVKDVLFNTLQKFGEIIVVFYLNNKKLSIGILYLFNLFKRYIKIRIGHYYSKEFRMESVGKEVSDVVLMKLSPLLKKYSIPLDIIREFYDPKCPSASCVSLGPYRSVIQLPKIFITKLTNSNDQSTYQHVLDSIVHEIYHVKQWHAVWDLLVSNFLKPCVESICFIAIIQIQFESVGGMEFNQLFNNNIFNNNNNIYLILKVLVLSDIFLHFNRTEGATTDAMDRAAENGHFDVVQFLHFNRSEGCTKKAIMYACDRRHLEIVSFLINLRKEECTERLLERTVNLDGPQEIVEFLVSQLLGSLSIELIQSLIRHFKQRGYFEVRHQLKNHLKAIEASNKQTVTKQKSYQ